MVSVITNLVMFVAMITVPLSFIALWRSHRQTDSLSLVLFAFSVASLLMGVKHLLDAVNVFWPSSVDALVLVVIDVLATAAVALAACMAPIAVRLLSVVPQCKQVRTTNSILARQVCELEDTLRSEELVGSRR